MVKVGRKPRREPVKIAELSDLSKVMVGFPAGESEQSVINVAVWNHYGTQNIPPRPFMLNAMRKNRRAYIAAIKSSAAKILNGSITTTQAVEKLGIMAQGHVRKEITELSEPVNAESTIKNKGSSNPLIDKGVMRAAVTWGVHS